MQQGKSFIRRLISDSVVYGLTRYLAVFAALFLMPFYTRIFTKTEYGIQDFFNIWNNFAIIVLPLGLVNTTLRWWVDIKDKPHEKKLVLGTNLSIITGLSLIYVAIMILFRPLFISTFIGDFENDGKHDILLNEIYFLCIYIAVASVMVSYFQNIQRSKFDKWGYAAVSLSSFFILTIGGFVLVKYFDHGIEGFYRASAIGITVSLLLSAYLVRKEIYFDYDSSTAREVLSYGFNFMTVMVMFQAINILDRYLIKTFIGWEYNGIYSIGKRIADFLLFISYSFQMVWLPNAMEIKNDPNAKKVYSRVHDFYVFTLGLFFLAILLFRKELIDFFAPTYHDAFNMIFYLGIYNLLNGIGPIYTIGMHITKQTKYLTYAAFAAVVFHTLTGIWLVRYFGIDGIAIGCMVGGVVWTGLRYYYSQKLFPVEFSWKLFTLTIGLSTLFFLTNADLDQILNGSLFIAIAVKTLIMIVISLIFIYLYKPAFLQRFGFFTKTK